MRTALFIKLAILICLATSVFSQSKTPTVVMLQEDKTPSVVKNLPDAESIRNRAVYTKNTDDLRKALGEQAFFDLIRLGGGVEAVTAPYPQGKLLIVEYPTPQASIDADAQFIQRFQENPPSPPVYYRRIGNYSAFVLEATDETAANSLLDRVQYPKTIQWLDENPLPAMRAEREFAIQTGDLFLSTVILVVGLFSSTIVGGLIVGLVFFYIREQKRATTQIFTDAGGMTRLNIDGLTVTEPHERLLKD